MRKDFKKWSVTKNNIHENGNQPFYHEREVWWCALGTNIGFEQDGTGKQFDRPVVILRAFNRETFLGVALTGRKREDAFHFYLGTIGDRDGSAILSQVRLLDTKRLIKKITVIDTLTYDKLRRACKQLLFP